MNTTDLRNEPPVERKRLLKRMLKKAPNLRYTEHTVAEASNSLPNLGLEGMVAKKANSRYVGGRTKDWLKMKTRAGKEVIQKRIETWGHKG